MVQLSTLSGGSTSGSSSIVTADGWGFGTKPAKYILASNNTSQGVYEFVFYDQDFAIMHPTYDGYSNFVYHVTSPVVRIGNGNHSINQSFMWNSWTGTQSHPSSSSGWYFCSSVNSALNVGPGFIDVFADGSYGNNGATVGEKHYLNNRIINSDHTDAGKIYVHDTGYIKCFNRNDFSKWFPEAPGTKNFQLPAVNSGSTSPTTAMRGTGSYNKSRKEYIGLHYNTGAYTWDVWHYKGVDFDAYPSPHDAFTNATTATYFELTLSTNPSSSSNESFQNPKMCLCDDGTAFICIMDPSYNNKLYTFTVPTDGTDQTSGGAGSTTQATHVTDVTLTTSYGMDSGDQYGLQMIESGDRRSIAFVCPYYYYHCGSAVHYVCKESINKNRTYSSISNSSYAYQVMPHKDTGFVTWQSQNVYAGNWSGAYLEKFMHKNADGMHEQSNAQQYMPMFPGPNTTNYPAMSPVQDYWLHSYRDLK